MTPIFAFLRGLNVGGHRVTKPELIEVFTSLGLGETDTFLASGNVVFTTGRPADGELASGIESALQSALGYAVPTLLRTSGEVTAVADMTPFAPTLLEESKGKLQVMFIRDPPAESTREDVLAMAPAGEHLLFTKRELFWLPSAGVLDSDLDLTAVERALGVVTMRTKNTVERIEARYLAG